MTSLLSIADLNRDSIADILKLAQAGDIGRPLVGKGAALVFQKPSARTRNSMEMAVVQLGGHPVYIQKDEVGLGTRESVEDVARTLACYHSLIAARVMDHRMLVGMTAAVETPILNMLSDTDHPLQALADLLTMQQIAGGLEGVKVAWIGDGDNNVCRSLAQGCSLTGAELTIASPEGYGMPQSEVDALPGVRQVVDPAEAIEGAQFIHTDVWVSMGQDDESETRLAALGSYRVDEALMEKAKDAWFMHCMPARRGLEVTDSVIDGPRSVVWRQAENRMHSARGAIAWLLGKGG